MPVERLCKAVQPNYEGLLRNLRREGTPDRVYFTELFLDAEVQDQIMRRFGIGDDLDPNDTHHWMKRHIALQRFLGYDEVMVAVGGWEMPMGDRLVGQDTAPDVQRRGGGRSWVNEQRGIIASWEDLERYPWPDPARMNTDLIEWCEANVPDDMCLRAGCHHILEFPMWLMGYETMSFAMYDDPALVDAVFERVGQLMVAICEILVQFKRVELIFGGDDMGFRTGTMISPQALREKALPWHRRLAEIAHAHGKLYILHACGNLEEIMPDLIEEVRLDGKHSFEDVIEPVTEAKRKWGDRLALLGGIDVDFLARADEAQIRRRVRETLDVCLPGGGYTLGSGNSVANYIPVDNYLAMVDEGRRYA